MNSLDGKRRISCTELRRNLSKYVNEVIETGEILVITYYGKDHAVILPIPAFRELIDAERTSVEVITDV